ncbi:hypothetical protein CYMTET_13841 [Cymbomonas tetramitiformis]|uniref:Uncharacterized protein n=1 Tax=Cymbomonas tetramitiformis TaxID=36881 RepID=A0AAE0GHA1_9CHLO|nr:hypothetical protein CYMTET_13841 [Cymbomonas tetramitiformis]
MRVEYIIPTHDAQGEPVQMFAAPDGALLDLPWPLLVVYAPPARQRVKRERKTSSPPPIVRTGEAASVRDLHQQISGGQFLKALQAEYERPGPLQTLRKEIQEAPHQRTRDFCVVGDVLWRLDTRAGTKLWNEYCDASGGKGQQKMWDAGFHLALSVKRGMTARGWHSREVYATE